MTSNNQIFIGINPLISGWEKFNLQLLVNELHHFNSEFHFSGRRMIIGNDSPIVDIDGLIAFIKDIKPNNFKDDRKMHGVYINQ